MHFELPVLLLSDAHMKMSHDKCNAHLDVSNAKTLLILWYYSDMVKVWKNGGKDDEGRTFIYSNRLEIILCLC